MSFSIGDTLIVLMPVYNDWKALSLLLPRLDRIPAGDADGNPILTWDRLPYPFLDSSIGSHLASLVNLSLAV